jgi:hypothetical protein
LTFGKPLALVRHDPTKEVDMKRRVIHIVWIGIALATAAAYAQTEGIKANVPFDFYAGKVLLPQGSYHVNQVEGARVVTRIRCNDCTGRMLLLTNPVISERREKPQLVFHRYGNEYFLIQIWDGGSTGRILAPSSREKELAADGTRPVMAVLATLRR